MEDICRKIAWFLCRNFAGTPKNNNLSELCLRLPVSPPFHPRCHFGLETDWLLSGGDVALSLFLHDQRPTFSTSACYTPTSRKNSGRCVSRSCLQEIVLENGKVSRRGLWTFFCPLPSSWEKAKATRLIPFQLHVLLMFLPKIFFVTPIFASFERRKPEISRRDNFFAASPPVRTRMDTPKSVSLIEKRGRGGWEHFSEPISSPLRFQPTTYYAPHFPSTSRRFESTATSLDPSHTFSGKAAYPLFG